jgi:hypothetical protein
VRVGIEATGSAASPIHTSIPSPIGTSPAGEISIGGQPTPTGFIGAAGSDGLEARKRPEVLRLMTHPGVGPLTALAFVLIIGSALAGGDATAVADC